MASFTYYHRVRFRECDPMGVVYHTHYVDYFEAARTEALRAMHLPYREIEEMGIDFPVIEVNVRYRRPARYDDLLAVTCILDEVPATRMNIRYEVRRVGEDEILTTGAVILCFLDNARQRPIAAPPVIRAAFERALAEGFPPLPVPA